MAYESSAGPIKLGYLFDVVLPEGFPQGMRQDLTRPFELVGLGGRFGGVER